MRVQLIETPSAPPVFQDKIPERPSLFPWLVFLYDFGNAKMTAIFDEFIDVEQYIAFWQDARPHWIFTAVQADVSFANYQSQSPECNMHNPMRKRVGPIPRPIEEPNESAFSHPGKVGSYFVVVKGLSPALIREKIMWHEKAIQKLYSKFKKGPERTKLLMSHWRVLRCYEKELVHAQHIEDRIKGD